MSGLQYCGSATSEDGYGLISFVFSFSLEGSSVLWFSYLCGWVWLKIYCIFFLLGGVFSNVDHLPINKCGKQCWHSVCFLVSIGVNSN